METLVNALRQAYPNFTFVAGDQASWSAQKQQVTYALDESPGALWTVLHELGHAILGHASYESDLQLLQKETAAWNEAVELSAAYGIDIDNDHIQDCLDTYRDWLHKRSTCPTCGDHGLQSTQSLYNCLNCQNTWKVSSARFCRPYRLKKALMTK
jgi:hypothetical protein